MIDLVESAGSVAQSLVRSFYFVVAAWDLIKIDTAHRETYFGAVCRKRDAFGCMTLELMVGNKNLQFQGFFALVSCSFRLRPTKIFMNQNGHTYSNGETHHVCKDGSDWSNETCEMAGHLN